MDIDSTKLRRLDFTLLLVFRLLYRQRKATVVAHQLGLSQPAISHALSRLRAVIGDPLFIRHSDGFVPNGVATALAPLIDEILETANRALGASDFLPRETRRHFRIVTVDYIAAPLTPILHARLLEDAPHARFSIRFGTGSGALQLVRSEAVDMAIGRFDSLPHDHESVLLSEEEYAVIMRVGHPLTHHLSLDDYADASHLLVSFNGDHYGTADRSLLSIRKKRNVAASVPLFMTAMPVVAASDMISMVPRRMALEHGEKFGLVHRPPPFPMEPFALSIVTHKRHRTDASLAWFQSIVIEAWEKLTGRS
ncbi:LysR family transcriptional regulator [Rhizobium mesosinicum]|uniref:LysR family transcriptional regulator n=1 Tax=Rhizobium mesosinicum TaxID=335017 RepID=A0ABS7GMC8_9HYPH|nr:LysR family transcriptional regulator [Rhizobium mesosinicum]MBW9051135.1 LysR family transcriptional regulator [Rhizobium mesosinicum]